MQVGDMPCLFIFVAGNKLCTTLLHDDHLWCHSQHTSAQCASAASQGSGGYAVKSCCGCRLLLWWL
jgi:hypothetical protein